jgi:2-oxoglutarate ferredoxin oxidoreductase subunit alpha
MSKDGSLVIRIGGESGEGIVTIGDLLTRIAALSGCWVYTFRTFPAEILGGHVVFQMRVGGQPLRSVGDEIDVVVGMNQEAYEKHFHLIHEGGVFIYDSSDVRVEPSEHVRLIEVPVGDLANEIGVGAKTGKNIIMIGALAQLLGLSHERAEQVIRRELGRRADLLPANLLSLKTGYEWAAANLEPQPDLILPTIEWADDNRLAITGNQALALGALAAGLKFYAGYPITPATDIMELLAAHLPGMGGTLIQAEDEIAAFGMCMGASFAGQRAMTATSGPGMALMLELLGHASMSEVPVVLVDVQRAGPSTGMPTKTAQADLWMALYGGNDEAPRIVIAPTSVEDCFYQMVNAFNLAERFQMPAIVLGDQALASRIETIPDFRLSEVTLLERLTPDPSRYGSGNGGGNGYERYAITESGVSPMSIPGMAGLHYTAEGLEHLEGGEPNYDPQQHAAMTDKRWRKLESAYQEYRTWPDMFSVYGADRPDLGIITWGSSEGAVREAIARQLARGRRVAAFVPKVLSPLPREELLEFANGCQAILIPELNSRGQFAGLLRSELGIDGYRLNKYQGLPFFAGEIEDKINQIYDELNLPEDEKAVEGYY